MLHTKVTDFTGLCSLLWDSHPVPAAVKFAYPGFGEHGDERSRERDHETSVEESIDDSNVPWRGEVMVQGAISHHLRLVNQDVLDGIQRVRFEAAEFDEERAQETSEYCGLHIRSIQSKVKGGKTYEDENSIHLFEPHFLTHTVDGPCPRSRIRDHTVM